MKKRVLLVDTNFSAKPIYDFLLSTGYEVYVVGGNPLDILAKAVTNYIHLDYSDVDELRTAIRRYGFDYIVPGGNDLSYQVCAQINEGEGFSNIDSVEVTEKINNKKKFRQTSLALGLHAPMILDKNEIKDHIPVIIKPVDAYSGHGMTVLHEMNNESIEQAIQLAKQKSKTGQYVIEEYVQGQLYSHSAFIVNGTIIKDFIVEEHCLLNPYVVDTSRVVFDFDKQILTKIRNDITTLAQGLALVDGLVHTQLICNQEDFWLIEVTRRCPGDLYSMLVEYSTGFPYAEYYTRPFIEEIHKPGEADLQRSFVVRHTMASGKPTVFNAISFKSSVHIMKSVPLTVSGDAIKETPYSRVGLMFFGLQNKAEQEELMQQVFNKQLYVME